MKRKIYICAPITENIYEDIHQAMKYAEYVLKCGMAPVIPHCYYLCMSKLDEKELETIRSASISLLWYSDEVWVFGDEVTENMERELQFCKTLNMRIRKISRKDLRKKLGGYE